ncbi:MAG: glutamate synthase subunit alpha, partial [Thiotrichales bacterium]|nr:glutamate synthase subunit alpha [Thiotrichales bacterium]
MTQSHTDFAQPGLYEPSTEHDSCGVGFVVNIKGQKSHQIVDNALTILKNLLHRGACGCEENTGDGVGILIQKPDRFFQRECQKIGIDLPASDRYGAGLVFLPTDPEQAAFCEQAFADISKEEGQKLLGWRDVPTDDSSLGPTARAGEPAFKQIFIACGDDISDSAAFDRKLYVIRKRVENRVRESDLEQKDIFYVPSLSYRTFLYKGMLTGSQIEPMFPEISDPDVESAMALVHQRFSTNTLPEWKLAQPFRYICHNGEINTVRGNANWMRARES